jgi:protein required for attachment to host cells
MTAVTHWIVVADSSTATVYSGDAALDDLRAIHRLEHPASRLAARDLVTDDRGRTQAFGGGARSATDPHHTPHEVEVQAFAHEIAQHLRKGLVEHAYEGLVLVAPPAFLGRLKLEIDLHTSDRVVGTVAHDYVHAAPGDLGDLLRRQLRERDPVRWAPSRS